MERGTASAGMVADVWNQTHLIAEIVRAREAADAQSVTSMMGGPYPPDSPTALA